MNCRPGPALGLGREQPGAQMSFINVPIGGGRLKVKMMRDMRRPEREREVWVLNLGFVIVTWWSGESIERYNRDG
jgi:hypothetical protein